MRERLRLVSRINEFGNARHSLVWVFIYKIRVITLRFGGIEMGQKSVYLKSGLGSVPGANTHEMAFSDHRKVFQIFW